MITLMQQAATIEQTVIGLTFVIAWAAIYALGFMRGGSGFARPEVKGTRLG